MQGKIECKEIESMLREVYGDGYETNQHAGKLMDRINRQVSSKNDHSVSLDAFSRFSAENPAMLFPAFEMQRKIQKAVLGVSFWQQHLDRRIKLVDDGRSFISVKQLLAMRVNTQAFKEMVEEPLDESAARAEQFGTAVGASEQGLRAIDAAGTRGTRGGGQAAFAAAGAKAKLGRRLAAGQNASRQQRSTQQQHALALAGAGALAPPQGHSPHMKAGWERRA